MKPGTKIVCIDNIDMTSDLTIGKIYTILEHGNYNDEHEFFIIMGNVNPGAFHPSRFVSIRKFRKLKLEKLYESNLH